MTEYKRIGIDTSKSVFALHGIDASDQPTLRRNVSRAGLLAFFRELLPTEIVMEACGAAYHWARELTAFGHGVRLIPRRYVKPFVKLGKNDRKDAVLLDSRIEQLDARPAAAHKASAESKRLATIPGIGPAIAPPPAFAGTGCWRSRSILARSSPAVIWLPGSV
jgi:transposase